MPKGQVRLSAVARQRSLRNGHTPPTVSSAIPLKRGIDQIISSPATSPKHEEEISRDGSPTSKDDVRQNQFDSLVEASAVSFIPDRQIEQINERSIKIRLGRSEKCAVIGSFTIWVKQGIVFMGGATIHASITTHHVYAPTTNYIPLIETVSDNAEFQLESLDDGCQVIPWVSGPATWLPPRGTISTDLTFTILGYSLGLDMKSTKRLKYLRGDEWRTTFSRLTATRTGQTRRILVCGGKSSASTFALCLLNSFLTARTTKGSLQHPEGTTFIDLNSGLPEFTPPGTIALSRIRQPSIGPSFTHVIRGRNTEGNQVLKMHFVPEGDTSFDLVFASDLLDYEARLRLEHSTSPLVIVTPDHSHDSSLEGIKKLWTKMALTDLVVLNSASNAKLSKIWLSLAEEDQVMIHRCNSPMSDDTIIARQCEMQMQSVFHRADIGSHLNIWEEAPLLSGTIPHLSCRYYGSTALFRACHVLDVDVSLANTMSALEHSICGIIKVQQDHFEQLMDTYGLEVSGENIARLMPQLGESMVFSPSASECLGLILIKEINVEHGILHFFSSIPMTELVEARSQATHELVLVVPRNEAGQWGSTWMYKEMEMATKFSQATEDESLDEATEA